MEAKNQIGFFILMGGGVKLLYQILKIDEKSTLHRLIKFSSSVLNLDITL